MTSCNLRNQAHQEKDDYVAWVEDINSIKRDDKKPAHILAHHAKVVDDHVAWVEETPSFLEVVIAYGVLNSFFVFVFVFFFIIEKDVLFFFN